MTVTTTASAIQYAGNGVTTSFSFPYVFFADTDLVVTLINTVTGQTVVPASILNGAGTYDYSISGVYTAGEYQSGADVVFVTAPPTGTSVNLVREVPATQDVELIDNAKFPAQTVNTEFDKLTVLVQQSGFLGNRAYHVPATDPVNTITEVPSYLTRADRILGFDSNGDVMMYVPTAEVIGDLMIGGPQENIGQLGQITAPFTNPAASKDVFRVQLGDFRIEYELSSIINGDASNWAIVGGTMIPAGAGPTFVGWPSGGVAGYALTQNPTVAAVGIYGAAGIAPGGGGATAGNNFVALNTTIQSGLANTGQDFNALYAVEADVVIQTKAGGVAASGAFAAGFAAILNTSIQPIVNASAGLLVSTVNQPWQYGMVTITGSCLVGISLGAIAAAGPQNSQSIDMTALDAGSVGYAGRIYVNPTAGVLIEDRQEFVTLGVGKLNNVQGTLIRHSAGNSTIFQILNSTVNPATAATLSMQTGTANSFLNMSVTDAGTASITAGAGVPGGLVVQTSGMTVSSSLTTLGTIFVDPGTALTSGGSSTMAVKASTTSNFGLYWGLGAPSISAATGSLYLRNDSTGPTDRIYVNINGATTWTHLVAGA